MFSIATIAAGVNTVLIGKTHRPVDHSDLCNCDFDMSHSHSHFPPTRLPSHHGPSTQDARVYTAKKEKGSQAAVSSLFSQTLAEALPATAELCLGEAPEISPPFRSPGHSLGVLVIQEFLMCFTTVSGSGKRFLNRTGLRLGDVLLCLVCLGKLSVAASTICVQGRKPDRIIHT